jgi:cell division initiation protein
MNLTALDIQRQSFETRFRGYDPDEVRTFLNVVAEEMVALSSENERLDEEVRRQSSLLAEHHEREQILKNTLVAAQRTSEEMKENAKKQSQLLLKEAELVSDRLVETAQTKAHDVERDILELKQQKRQMFNSILSAISNLRNLIQSMSEAETQQDKVSFLKRRSSGTQGTPS